MGESQRDFQGGSGSAPYLEIWIPDEGKDIVLEK